MSGYDYRMIKAARLRAGMTQQHAADAAGMGIRQWQKYEGNEIIPSIETFLRVATALDIDPAELLKVK